MIYYTYEELQIIKYRGTHGNLRLWRECETGFPSGITQFSSKQESPRFIYGECQMRLL